MPTSTTSMNGVTSNHKPPLVAIICGVIGGLFGLCVFMGSAIWILRLRKNREKSLGISSSIMPYDLKIDNLKDNRPDIIDDTAYTHTPNAIRPYNLKPLIWRQSSRNDETNNAHNPAYENAQNAPSSGIAPCVQIQVNKHPSPHHVATAGYIASSDADVPDVISRVSPTGSLTERHRMVRVSEQALNTQDGLNVTEQSSSTTHNDYTTIRVRMEAMMSRLRMLEMQTDFNPNGGRMLASEAPPPSYSSGGSP
ncbi:hypothetical protein BT96DRAFT_1001058 [Gymnopus androsaceus JB14]|uniref:Uncharacterized protein n=1 Tax=Gymnopus androsaceus JB14 TaxID=1447944 RepID=A0A6A4H0F7_9AGAR|nr:hypothetical protein BT96DRAFT_1001058 [Gymnopus androsaceus JB14]